MADDRREYPETIEVVRSNGLLVAARATRFSRGMIAPADDVLGRLDRLLATRSAPARAA